jgi:DNA processing protein
MENLPITNLSILFLRNNFYNMDKNLRYKIALSLLSGLGPIKTKLLLKHYGSAENVFSENDISGTDDLNPKIKEKIFDGSALKRADEEIEFIEKNHIQVRFIGDADYPERLLECPDAPIVLYSKGSSDLNAKKLIAIVGTRRCTPYGRDLTGHLVCDLAQAFPELIIVSGLAYGIDVCAHRAALEYGLNTIGVLAHGLNEIYPPQHRHTAIEMLTNGSLVTELPSGTPSEPWRFVQRNRIVAGMCDACVVIESAKKGGSLITAQMAFDYNREVFAFPGRSIDEKSIGCNMLIKKQIGTLVESAEDIVREMNWEETLHEKPVQGRLFPVLQPTHQKIYDSFTSGEKYSSEQIAIQEHTNIGEILSILMQLEMAGLVIALPGGFYCKKT